MTEVADTLDRALGAYLGLALGDALGATVEFMTPREIAHQFAHQGGVHRHIVGGGWLKLAPGQVTDDTTMSLALGEALLRGERTGRPFDTRLELWIAPSMNYLPVRIRVTQSNGDFVDQKLRASEPAGKPD